MSLLLLGTPLIIQAGRTQPSVGNGLHENDEKRSPAMLDICIQIK